MKYTKILKTSMLILIIPTLFISVAYAQKPQYGGTLTLGWYNDLGSFNPVIDFWNQNAAQYRHIYNMLVMEGWDENGKLQVIGDLAESFKSETNEYGGKTWTFYLHKDVTWHDGNTFTADDVKFTFEYNQEHSERMVSRFFERYDFKEINVLDPYTVEIVFGKNIGIHRFMTQSLNILPKHIWEGTDPATNPRRFNDPIGTGPYMFKEWVPNVYSRYVRNPNYFKEGLPYLDEIVFKVIPTKQGVQMALQTGEVNMGAILPEAKDQFEAMGYTVYPVVRFIAIRMTFNFREDWMSEKYPWVLDKNVREAICHAMDPDTINEVINAGLSIVTPGPVDPRSYYFNPKVNEIYDEHYSYDPALAEQMLDDAGYPRGSDGVRFEFEMPCYGSFAYFTDVIVEQLKQVGINANALIIDDTAFVSQIEFTEDGAKDYPVVLMQEGMGTLDPGALNFLDPDRSTSGGLINVGYYDNPRVTELLYLGADSDDIEERREYFFEMQELIMEDIQACYLFAPLFAFAWAPGLNGYENYVDFAYDNFEDIWMEQEEPTPEPEPEPEPGPLPEPDWYKEAPDWYKEEPAWFKIDLPEAGTQWATYLGVINLLLTTVVLVLLYTRKS
jgi:peptide/nickel transport system substrate-binding protein